MILHTIAIGVIIRTKIAPKTIGLIIEFKSIPHRNQSLLKKNNDVGKKIVRTIVIKESTMKTVLR